MDELWVKTGTLTKPGWDRLDRIGLRIGWDPGSDRTGIFAFGAEELFWEKQFLLMTQVARINKSEFSQQESNLWLVQHTLGLVSG